MKTKSWITGVLTFGLMLFFGTSAQAVVDSDYREIQPTILVNGAAPVDERDPAQIYEGRTMVPVRSVFDYMGATVRFIADGSDKAVYIRRNSTEVVFPVGEDEVIVNGEMIEEAAPLRIEDGRSLIPLRFVSELFGADVAWNNTWKTARITDAASPGYGEEDGTSLLDGRPYERRERTGNGYEYYNPLTDRTVVTVSKGDDNATSVSTSYAFSPLVRYAAGEIAAAEGFPVEPARFARMTMYSSTLEINAPIDIVGGLRFQSSFNLFNEVWTVSWPYED
ncbi:stalk domain-containing protein [Alkalicoccus urumqiensis]|uniref:Copper amine oxidase-like N-terminal domain-containing protein n=1 Tax=Alkalicoccus urumqiensis TaxID=1548213 RepID=A0A2P6ME51_ALKUR|nr:stalk domain-containing protein [Alkalicoccus urumqiensis]PRO64550.1 hypothetical protein C6I21_13695 [Alkalicoccus urumqiensis]